MTRRTNFLLAGGIVAAAFLTAVVLVRMRPEPPRAPAPSMAPMVATVDAEGVTGALTVLGSGTVRPRAEIELAPQVGGQVTFVSPSLVSGGRFRAGEVLLRVEDADYRNAVRQARAQVAQDEVAVLQAEEETRLARQEYDQFLQRRSGGAGAGDAAQASRLVLREPQLDAARATLERALAQLADAELDLERTAVRAPFDGVVRSENVDEGAYRNAGQTVATIYASDAVEVVVPLSDEQAALLPGLWELGPTGDETLPARVMADFGAGRFMWEGFVHRAEAALDEQSRTLDVVVRIPRPFQAGQALTDGAGEEAPPLLVGQYVEVELEGRTGDFVRLPRRALRTDNEIWAVENGAVRIVQVRLIQRDDRWVYVTGALGHGTAVVVEGIDVTTPGMSVRLRSEAEEVATGAVTGGLD